MSHAQSKVTTDQEETFRHDKAWCEEFTTFIRMRNWLHMFVSHLDQPEWRKGLLDMMWECYHEDTAYTDMFDGIAKGILNAYRAEGAADSEAEMVFSSGIDHALYDLTQLISSHDDRILACKQICCYPTSLARYNGKDAEVYNVKERFILDNVHSVLLALTTEAIVFTCNKGNKKETK